MQKTGFQIYRNCRLQISEVRFVWLSSDWLLVRRHNNGKAGHPDLSKLQIAEVRFWWLSSSSSLRGEFFHTQFSNSNSDWLLVRRHNNGNKVAIEIVDCRFQKSDFGEIQSELCTQQGLKPPVEVTICDEWAKARVELQI